MRNTEGSVTEDSHCTIQYFHPILNPIIDRAAGKNAQEITSTQLIKVNYKMHIKVT